MAVNSEQSVVYRAPTDEEWPREGLENLGCCPICKNVERSVAFTGLRDKTFFCAPGVWTAWRCAHCNVVYLDPRPTKESIGLAYSKYYTHAGRYLEPKSQNPLRVLFKVSVLAIKNAYINKRFGYRLRPALPFGHLLLNLMPRKRRLIGRMLRHLPSPQSRKDRILDIGCGNGEFLQIAQEKLGYIAEGLELDEKAAEVGRANGLKIYSGSVPGSGLEPASYQHVFLSHVLEHLHDPISALREAFELLLPGGRVWISIPNISASSIERFGSDSRLLEPPRHLVMFDANSLCTLMQETGFLNVCEPEPIDFLYHDSIFIQSWMASKGIDPNNTPWSIVPKSITASSNRAYADDATLKFKPEIVTLVGVKPP